MNSDLTIKSPFSQRFRAYINERFPLWSHLSMVMIYFLANQFLAQVLGRPDKPLQVGWFTFVGTLFLLCIFFHLRVFDEHKDYEDDCKHFPDRILSRGLIPLHHLKVGGAIVIAVELLCAGISGFSAIVAVGTTIFFSWIMLHEFFVQKWLKAHFIIYAFAHMLIMPLMTATIFSFTMRRHFWHAPGSFGFMRCRTFWLLPTGKFRARFVCRKMKLRSFPVIRKSLACTKPPIWYWSFGC